MVRSTGSNPYDLGDGRGLGPVIALAGRLAAAARTRRLLRYLETMQPLPEELLLDVGSGGEWSLARQFPRARVTGVDLIDRGGISRPHQRFVVADACAMPFADDEFDVAYSNSVIEHVARARRPAFADEVRRVARRYWVQTPNFWFPLEPHALLPGAQFLPSATRRAAWRASPRTIAYEPSLELLTKKRLAGLFDDALILSERIGPLTKSLIAVGPRELFVRRGRQSQAGR